MPHLMLDCYGTNERILNSLGNSNELLVELCAELSLKPVMPPFLLPYYYPQDVEDEGISSFVLLKGGHVTLHTFPKRRCFFADIFTERFFDVNKTLKFFNRRAPHAESNHLSLNRRFIEKNIPSAEVAEKFGAHIVCRFSPGRAITMENIFDMLDGMPQKVNMQQICRPLVIKDSRTKPEFLSGMVLIAQSHISIHYSLAENIAYFDLFSCTAFDSAAVAETLKRELKADIEFQIAPRGIKYADRRAEQNDRITNEGGWTNVSK